MKTASRMLGSALFRSGYRVQDAPRYGAERRGAPIYAYVRAAREVINERGVITRPDLVLVADDSLLSIPAAGVCQGLADKTVLVLHSRETAETWRHRLNLSGPTFVLPMQDAEEEGDDARYTGAALVGAAARLLGVIPRESLVEAVTEELSEMTQQVIDDNITEVLRVYDAMKSQQGCVIEGAQMSAESFTAPQWVESLFEDAQISAPVIHDGLTSKEVRTGLWRTMRPVIEYDRCNRCWWVCSTFCPDSAININNDGYPEIDYDHCKGCMICVAKCPPHAITAVSEHDAQAQEALAEGAGS